MVIFETAAFTKAVSALLDDDEYAALQRALATKPYLGKVVRGTGGLRKMRWSGSGRGKRGGIRVIYYWIDRMNQIYMLLAYAKNRQDDLTPEQKRVLSKLVEVELGNG